MTVDDVLASRAAVLTVSQAARLLTDLDGQPLDERTVRRGCELGQIPSVRVGNRLLIPRLPLLALLGATPDMSEAGPASPATAATSTHTETSRADHTQGCAIVAPFRNAS